MLNLLNAEFYKLFHSRYFWGIVAFNRFFEQCAVVRQYWRNIQFILCIVI